MTKNQFSVFSPDSEIVGVLQELQSTLSRDCVSALLLDVFADWVNSNDELIDTPEYSETISSFFRFSNLLIRLEYQLRNSEISTIDRLKFTQEHSDNVPIMEFPAMAG